MAEQGLAKFAGREVARRAGYSVGTIYNVFGSLDRLIAAINSHTFALWADFLHQRLADAGADRIRGLVEGYFDFALANPQLWSAIYDHRMSEGEEMSAEDHAQRGALTTIVETEVRAALGENCATDVHRFARSLIAVVHGHCSYEVSGSFALLDEPDPAGAALARVRECLAAQK